MLRELKPDLSRWRVAFTVIPLAVLGLLGAALWCQPKEARAASKPQYRITVDVWNQCGKPCRVRISTGPGSTIKDVKLQPGKLLSVTYTSDSYTTRFEFTPDGGDKYTYGTWPPKPLKSSKWKWTATIRRTSNPKKVTADISLTQQ
jgi:hypothetical protein